MAKLTEEEKEDLIKTISERVIAGIKEPLLQLGRKVDSVQTTCDITNSDLGEDRKSLAQIAIESATTSQGVRELVELSNRQTTTIAKKVAEKASEVIETATNKVAEAVGPEIAEQVKKLNKNAKLTPPKSVWERIKLLFRSIKK